MKIESRTSQFEYCTHKGVRNRPGVVGVREVKLKKRGSDFTVFAILEAAIGSFAVVSTTT